MTILSSLLEEWQIPLTPIRSPHWLAKHDRTLIAEAIVDLCQTTTVFPAVRARLDAVLTELGVAEARDQMWPQKAEIVRRSQGYASDVLPIRMSDDELTAVLSLPALPTDLLERLAPTKKK